MLIPVNLINALYRWTWPLPVLAIVSACSDSPQPPTGLDIEPNSLQLQALPAASVDAAATLSNAGAAALQFSVSSDVSWIELGATNGTVPAGQSVPIQLTATCPATSDEHTLNGTIDVVSDAGTQSLAVRLDCNPADELNPPRLASVNPLAIDLTGSVEQVLGAALSFANAGGMDLEYVVSSDAGWITVESAQGRLQAAASTELELSLQCPSTSAVLSGALDITTNGGNRVVPVNLRCTDVPVAVLAAVMPVNIDLTAQIDTSASTTVGFRNDGTLALDYTISSAQPWITSSSDAGSLAAGALGSVTLTASCGASSTTRTGMVSIQSNGGNATLPLSLQCTPEPVALLSAVSPASLDLAARQGASAASSISFSNEGSLALNFNITNLPGWISVSTTTGTLAAGAGTTLDVTANCDDVTDERTGLIAIESNGGDRVVPLSLQCTPEPVALLSAVSPASLDLAARQGASAASSISFSNEGSLALNFNITNLPGWISVSTTTGTLAAGAGTTLDVTANCDDVTGERTGLIAIESNGGDDSVAVVLNCRPQLLVPSLSVQLIEAKTFRFEWSSSAGANHYQLYESADGEQPFMAVGPLIAAGIEQYNHLVSLHLRERARYRLSACDAAECVDSNTISVAGDLSAAIGRIVAPTGTASGFGEALALSHDGRVLAVLHRPELGVFGTARPSVSLYDTRLGVAPAQLLWEETVDPTSISSDVAASVSLNRNGSVLAIGVPQVDDESVGSVFIYRRQASGGWQFEARINRPTSGLAVGSFASSIALDGSGTNLLIADPMEALIYEYLFNGTSWVQNRTIVPVDTFLAVETFGDAIALNEDASLIAVSARVSRQSGISNAVYIYELDGADLQQTAVVFTPFGSDGDRYGESIVISGDSQTIVVGAPADTEGTSSSAEAFIAPNRSAGAVYVLTKDTGSWLQSAYLQANTPAGFDQFGSAVSLNDDASLLAVGAPFEQSASTGFGGNDGVADTIFDYGAVYLFENANGSWRDLTFIKPKTIDSRGFGHSVVISHDGFSLYVTSARSEDVQLY